MKAIKEGSKRYIIDEKRDLMIYKKVKQLEKIKLNKPNKELLNLIKTQLENNWRKYLINYLNKLLKKYCK